MNTVELALFSNRIKAICDQMGAVLQNTAFSPNIRDRLDYSCAIFDVDGQLCAQAAHIPVHLGSMAYAMQDIIRAQSWQSGDTLMLNNPFMGGTHLPDVTFVSPVFIADKLNAFVANRAHHADIGADSPGSMPISRSIVDEGIIISPTLITRNNRVIDAELNQLINRLRAPHIAKADFMAQISVNQTGIDALSKLINQCQDTDFATCLEALNDYARRIARHTFATLPDGEFHFRDVMDDDGLGNEDIPIECTITIQQSDITVDFAGTAEQVKGNINCPLSVTAAAVFYCFRCLMPAYVPSCAGTFDCIKLSVPEGNLLNASYPAAVAAGNVETSTRIVDVVLGALAQALPTIIPAASHGSMNNVAMGGNNWSYYETLGGGMGASARGRGIDAVQTHMTNTLNTPVEIVETHFPLLIREYSVRYGSAGGGLHNGGNGLCRTYQFLEPTQLTLLSERRNSQPWGLNDGENGDAGKNRLNGELIPGKTSIDVKADDKLRVETAGGGGWGRPRN